MPIVQESHLELLSVGTGQITKHPWRRSLVLVALLLCSVALYIWLITASPRQDGVIASFVQVWIICFLPYVAACALVLATKPARGRWQWIELGIILGGGLVVRAMLLPLTPGLSHDSWRYLWDARITLHGFSPYVYAPGDPILHPLVDPLLYGNMRFRNVPTIYPPGAQAIYLLSYLLAPDNLDVLKGIFVVFDMVTCGTLAWLLAKKGLDPRRAILYAWCPLPVVEFAIQGHLDAAAVTFTLLAIVSANSSRRGSRVLTGFLIGMATLTKIYPLLLLVAVVRRRDWPLLATCFATIILGYLPYLILGHGQVFGFFATYASQQGGNAGIFPLATYSISHAFGYPLSAIVMQEYIVDLLVVGLVSLIVLVWRLFKLSMEAATLILIGTALAISSHVFPWYTTALLPWVAILIGPLWTSRGPQARGIAVGIAGYFTCISITGYFFNTPDWHRYYLYAYGVVLVVLGIAFLLATSKQVRSLYHLTLEGLLKDMPPTRLVRRYAYRVRRHERKTQMTQQDTRQDAGDTNEKEPQAPNHPPTRFAFIYFKHLIISALAALGAGLTASLLAVVLMGILRLAAGIPTPVELFGDYVLKHINVDQFIRLLSQFSANPKTGPLGLTLLAMIGVGTAVGLLYGLLVQLSLPTSGYRPSRREWIVALALGLGMSAVGIILFWDELRQNFFGLPIDAATIVTALALVADFMLYGVALCLTFRILLPKQAVVSATATERGATNNRRQLFARAGVAVLGLGAGAGTLGLVRGFLNNYASYDGMETFPHNNVTAPITPNSEHYVVTQNAIDPSVNTSVWQLEITGLVGNSGSYTYEEIQKLPSTSRAITLECIANYTSGTGGHLISTAIWQGVTLSTLLLLHGGAQAGARYATFSSVDGYTVSLPLDEVLEADALLAWRMNGAELPQRHGFPLRVLIPGRYGEENPKWLTRIELTDHFVGGLYSDQGWYNGPLHTMSRIDRPRGRLAVGQPVEIGGFSFAGNCGIQRVEVSTDGGLTWNLAQLKEQLSLDGWVFWTYQWTSLLSGPYTLTARATDGTGAVQTSKIQGTVPNGATGYPEVMVEVV